jgi:tetratricopeptide (TPR) repeat protein
MDALFASVRAQLNAVQVIRAAEELPPWPPLPSGCADVRKTPSDRIKLLLDYVHEQLADEESRIILGLLPSTIGDPAAYSQVVSGLLPKDEIEPWMNNTRVLLRDDREARFLTPYIETRAVDGVVFYEGLDFSPDAVASGILAAARNPESSDEERMMALVQLAAIDFAHKRYAESFRKWGVCYAYFTQTKVDSMRALCVCGAADALRDSGKLREAKEKYQQGIAFPPSQETLPTTLNLLLGVSRTCILLEEWTEAEGYLDLADKVASKLCQAYPKCEVMERQGFVLFKQKRLGEARIRWRAAVDISRELQAFDVAERALEQLIALFEHAQMRTEKSEHERELAEVRIAAKMFEREHLHS